MEEKWPEEVIMKNFKPGDVVIPKDYSGDKNFLIGDYRWAPWRSYFVGKECAFRGDNKDSSASIFLGDGTLGCCWPKIYLEEAITIKIKEADIVVPRDFSRDDEAVKNYGRADLHLDFTGKECLVMRVDDDGAVLIKKISDKSVCLWPINYLNKFKREA